MTGRDEQRLDGLLREADPAPLDAATAEAVYERAWAAVRAGMADRPRHDDGARVAARRPDVLADADAA
ncbi:hypothetical protein, partial [Kineococcus glutinatus]|uniref:hypothetical protein n=1 Tax=Kineococcus glutinatus TaxID=1070872 RepID=UPI0031E6CD59